MSAIDEVKSRTDIVDLVSEYVQLQRTGRNFKARCPFHNEKTPSFIVTPDRQTWHCFGACGEGGDVFNFVMKREGIEFGDALRLLAEKAGVRLEDRREPEEDEHRQRLLQANEAAAGYFHNALLKSKAAEDARAYLDSRGLDAETIEAFQLGYSLESWDALKGHLQERGFKGEELLEAGLLVESDRGGYDRFRGRLIFPIRDDRGRVAGFGARALAADEAGAKYINTPQTPTFDKSGLLYGLDKAKEAIRREKSAIVVEGYMDAIAAHQYGIGSAVASMGTALTERQIRTLERFKAKILLAMDADAAGIEATLRALQEGQATGAVRAETASAHPEALDEQEFAAKVQEWSRDALKRVAVTFWVVPLSGKDPDEMIRADRAAWDAAIAEAKPFADHVFEVVAARKDRSQPGERAELLQELLPIVRIIQEPVNRAHYLQRLARLAQVDEEVVRAELRRSPARAARGVADTPQESAPIEHAQRENQEEFLLALLFRYPELRPEGAGLPPELFVLEEHRAIFSAWRETVDLDAMRRAVHQTLLPNVDRIRSKTPPVYEGARLEAAFRDCVRRIEFRRLSAAKQASTAALSEPEVQQELNVAVKGAYAQLYPDATEAVERDSRASEMTSVWVEDMEAGKRLHQSSPARTQTEGDSPPGEGTS